MKITPETLTFIQTVVHTAKMVNIDSIVIDSEGVRGLSEDNTCVLLEKNIPTLEIGSVGLNRTDVFQQRLEVVKGLDNFTIDAVVDEDKEFVRSLIMKAKGTKVDYRCANPTTIRAPRIINDETSSRVEITKDGVEMLQRGAAAMGSDIVEFISNADGVHFVLADTNNDTFKHLFAESSTAVDEDGDGYFNFKYPVKTLLSLFKDDSVEAFNIGVKGTMLVKVNKLGVYVLPKV